jgi:hypothetical protein
MGDDGLLKNAKDRARALKDSVVSKVEQGFDTVTGKAVLQKVAEFAQELDAVNTAMATRIYDLLDREAKLRERLRIVEADNRHYRKLVYASLAAHGVWLLAAIYIIARSR